jgi:hypothetical protein
MGQLEGFSLGFLLVAGPAGRVADPAAILRSRMVSAYRSPGA